MQTLKQMIARAAVVGCTALAVSQLFVSVPRVHAENISVTPPKFELLGNPGDTVTEKIKVTNDGTTQSTYQVDVEDFKASDDQGSVELIDDPNAPRTTYSLASWISVEPSRIVVPAGEEKVVDVNIKIPKNGEPGGHYASVLVRLAAQAPTPGTATVESRVGTLILLRVSGAVTEKLNVDLFKTAEPYYQNGPVDFELRTTNSGNVHVAPAGTIVINNIFGQKVKELPLTTANVLPGSSRIVHTSWDDKGMIGRYTATLVATYGNSKQNLTATTTFYVIPVYLIIVVIAVLLVLIYLLANRRKLRKILHNLTSD